MLYCTERYNKLLPQSSVSRRGLATRLRQWERENKKTREAILRESKFLLAESQTPQLRKSCPKPSLQRSSGTAQRTSRRAGVAFTLQHLTTFRLKPKRGTHANAIHAALQRFDEKVPPKSLAMSVRIHTPVTHISNSAMT